MKIEKINDNQIRCTLTQQDLENRHIRLSELAYGTEKANLFEIGSENKENGRMQ